MWLLLAICLDVSDGCEAWCIGENYKSGMYYRNQCWCFDQYDRDITKLKKTPIVRKSEQSAQPESLETFEYKYDLLK